MRRTGNRREVPAIAIDGCGGAAMTYWSLMGSLVARMRRLGALPIIGASACVNRQSGTTAAITGKHWNDSSLCAECHVCVSSPYLGEENQLSTSQPKHRLSNE